MKRLKFLLPPLAVFLICLYPCLFSFLRNAGEAKAADMLPVLALLLITAAALLAVGFLVLRELSAAGLFAGLSMLLIANGGLMAGALKRHFGWFHDRYLLILFLLAMLGLLLLLRRKREKLPGMELCAILAVVFAVLPLVQLIPAAPTLWQVLTVRPAQLEVQAEFSGERPNVYYFIVDEYGGTENLERYYGAFDNAPFLDGLRDRGFNISDTTKNTESIWTTTLVPNLMNLGYVVGDDVPERVRLEYLEKPLLFRLFRDNGYAVHLISHKDFISARGATLLNEKQYPDRITSLIFQNTAYAVIPYVRDWLQDVMKLDSFQNEVAQTREVLDAMAVCGQYAGEGPTLTVSYVQCPHYPYLFDGAGNVVYDKDSGDLRNQHFYFDQLTYLNSVLETAVDDIQARDPNCIIVIQSDHGARYPGQLLVYYGGPDYDPVEETPYMQNALNCVYWGGRTLDIEGETGINTWRLLLNEAFGTELPLLPAPEGYICYGREWGEPEIWNIR